MKTGFATSNLTTKASVTEMKNNPSLSAVRQAFERHQLRQDCVKLCQNLVQLIVHLQQHRGTTLAILGGDDFFEPRLQAIKKHIVEDLQELQKQRKHLVDEDTWQNLCSEWFTVNHHWRQDSALQNFEIHTHLIQQLLRQLKNYYHSPLFEHLDVIHNPIARLVLTELPEFLETAAQIRGIGTHLLASDTSETYFADRLKYLARYFTRTLQHVEQLYDTGRLINSESQWLEIVRAWNTIDEAVAKLDVKRAEGMPPEQFFSETSHIIYYIQQCLKLGLKRLNTATDQAIKAWIESGSYHTGT